MLYLRHMIIVGDIVNTHIDHPSSLCIVHTRTIVFGSWVLGGGLPRDWCTNCSGNFPSCTTQKSRGGGGGRPLGSGRQLPPQLTVGRRPLGGGGGGGGGGMGGGVKEGRMGGGV